MTASDLQPIREALLEKRCLVVAHRGYIARSALPENSLAAFDRAREFGAHGVELDVRLSRDFQLVVFHDASLQRMTGLAQRVGETPGQKIRQLPLIAQGESTGELVPILQQVLEQIGGKLYLNIELKAPASRAAMLATLVAQAVQQAGMLDWVWFSSFQPLALWHLKRLLPRAPAGLLFSRWHLFYRFLALRAWVDVLHPSVELLPRVHKLQACRKPLVFWTVNLPSQVKRLCALGAAAVITDDVEMAVRAREQCPNSG